VLQAPAFRYPARSDNPRPALPQAITAIHITIHAPALRTRSRPPGRKRRAPAPGSHRDRVTESPRD
jgi:hypothetical protein